MQLARVVGNVTLSRWHPSLSGLALRLASPLLAADVRGEPADAADEIVVVDELSAGQGALIAVADGREAAQPFAPEDKPVDAYNAALIDSLDL